MPEPSREASLPRPSSRVPWPLLAVSVASIVAGAVMALWGAYVVGITWDEKTNMLSLQEFFDEGWNITKDAIVDGQPDPAYIWGTYVYGPVSLLFTHLLAVVTGNESWGRISFGADAYAVRHVGGAMLGLLGLVAVALTGRVITRSWRWGVLAAALLAVIPMWIGHSMMNIKDTPVGSGFAIATLGLAMLMRPDYRSRWWFYAGALLAVSFGAFLAAGTRAASGAPIAGSVVVAGIAWWLLFRRSADVGGRAAFRGGLRRLLEAAAALVVAYLALLAVYPNAYKTPGVLAYQAVIVSAKFPFNEPLMFNGEWIGEPVPWNYLPTFFAVQLPLLILVGAVGFLVVWAVLAVRAVFTMNPALDRVEIGMTTPVVVQMVAVPVIAIATQATMYNAVRQYVFVVPAAALLATLGIRALVGWFSERGLARGWVTALWVAVVVGMIAPLVAQARLFPYNYVYYNAAAVIRGVDGVWPTDYWRASSNEIMRRLPANGPESCAYETGRKNQLSPCSIEPMFEPYLSERGSDALPGDLASGEYWLVRENQGRVDVPEGCRVHDEITRQLYGRTITIAQIVACPLPEDTP